MESNPNNPGVPRSERDRVVIFDTTLRDGEQCPGATMTFEEKLQVAELLDEMGVDIIEAGFPIASEGDFEAVRRSPSRAKHVGDLRARARATSRTSTAAARRSSQPQRGRIHTFIGTSPLHRQHQMQIDAGRGAASVVAASVTRARSYTDDVEWSAMDATRTEHDYLCRCVEAAIKAGATTINIPDTVGYALPEEYVALIRMIRDRVPGCRQGRSSRPIATTISGSRSPTRWPASRAGARQIECTINGLGERAGNAALEEIVMAHAHARRRAAASAPASRPTMLTRASKLVSARDRFPGAVQQGDRRPERLRA